MILHALPTASTIYASPWWVIHAETLTPVLAEIRANNNLVLHFPFTGEPPAFRSHEDATSRGQIAHQIAQDIRANFSKQILLTKTKHLTPAETNRLRHPLPEYLILFTGAGEQPAIFRSQDPQIIIPAEAGNESILGQPTYWKSTLDLPVEGWAYFWEDSQRAWDELAPAFLAATQATP